MRLSVSSPAFRDGERIPVRHTADGEDLSPLLTWDAPPAGCRSFALICDDPDAPAGTWVHWVLFNVPADARQLCEGMPREERLADGSRQGRNSWGRVGYNGPSPPRGKPHRYLFKLHALDAELPLAARAPKEELVAAMKGHVLAEGLLTGLYGR